MRKIDEYLRRNLLHAKACGVQAGIGAAMDRLNKRTNPPKWLIKLLDREHAKAYDVAKEMAVHRDELRAAQEKWLIRFNSKQQPQECNTAK